jgi:hypothetical protein
MKLIIEGKQERVTKQAGKPYTMFKANGMSVWAWPNQVDATVGIGDTVEWDIEKVEGMNYYQIKKQQQFQSSPTTARLNAETQPSLMNVEILENTRMIKAGIDKILTKLTDLKMESRDIPTTIEDDNMPF